MMKRYSLEVACVLVACGSLALLGCHKADDQAASPSGAPSAPGAQASYPGGASPMGGGPAASMGGPQAGEIQLGGVVQKVESAAGLFIMKVTTVTPPSPGQTITLHPARKKVVAVSQSTQIQAGGASTLAGLKPGAIISVIGKNTGDGKRMPAREITGGAGGVMAGGPPSGSGGAVPGGPPAAPGSGYPGAPPAH